MIWPSICRSRPSDPSTGVAPSGASTAPPAVSTADKGGNHREVAKSRRPASGDLDSRPPMPVRKTKRGADRTPLEGQWDVLVCGASFAGLTIARELAGSGARVLLIDRYEIGERQTSAC